MGLESANYHFVPDAARSDDLQVVLNQLHPHSTRTNGIFNEAAFVGEKYWIDTQRGRFQRLSFDSLSIRVALCNPPEAIIKLHDILKLLLARCGGYIVDKQNHARITSLDKAEWSSLENGFHEKQKDFFKWFGERFAPISGSKVFEYYRNTASNSWQKGSSGMPRQ